MAGPFKCTSFKIQIMEAGVGTVTIGVAEGFDIDLSYEGGVEHRYGSRIGEHAVGGKTATFSLRRWYMSDTDKDLLYDLFNDELVFTLTGELDGVSNSQISLSGCRIYRWRPRTGGANDIVGEEASGEALDWSSEIAD